MLNILKEKLLLESNASFSEMPGGFIVWHCTVSTVPLRYSCMKFKVLKKRLSLHCLIHCCLRIFPAHGSATTPRQHYPKSLKVLRSWNKSSWSHSTAPEESNTINHNSESPVIILQDYYLCWERVTWHCVGNVIKRFAHL